MTGHTESDPLWHHPTVLDAVAAHREVFRRQGAVSVAAAPGRVNLIGEHTDYNDGFVLPMAIDRYVAAAFAPNDRGSIRVHALRFRETLEIDLPPRKAVGEGHWTDYVAGVAWALAEAGLEVPGIDLAVAADLPLRAGLSSSAAIELATARALFALSDRPWDAEGGARLCQRAENAFVGVPCGIMDQLVVSAAREGSALLIDCRSLETTPVPIPDSLVVVVMDTGVERRLADSGYQERRQSCETAVGVLRGLDPAVRALRDVDGALLVRAGPLLDAVTAARAQHVVAECRRPGDLATALAAGDLARCRRLMEDSHWSLRDLYGVSCPELDGITALARAHPACAGARLTGAGFGGSAVALVEAGQAEDFRTSVEAAYRLQFTARPELHVCRPVGGVRLLR
ncbi:MAG: galactokinase [Gemmatimonadales bacterium]|nr:galactokinase [Gemmatimonadales bacterium]